MLTIFLRRRCSRGRSRLRNIQWSQIVEQEADKSFQCLFCPALYYYFSRASFLRASIEKTLKNVFDKNRVLFHFHASSLLISISSHVSTLLLRCSLRILSRSVRNIFTDIPSILDLSFFFFFFFFFFCLFFFFFFVSELFFPSPIYRIRIRISR